MFSYCRINKPNKMSKSTYVLETKTNGEGIRGERINKCVASSLSEAINTFASIKQLRPDQLVELFSVYEQPTDGKWPIKKRS